MSKEKYLITRLTNRKPISLNNIETIEKEGEVVFNYHETMISHIVEARENKEFEYICSEIQDFIERDNIDICFVINKDELIDCLQEHQKLKLKIADLEAKLAESEAKLIVADDCADRYWKQLDIVEQENKQLKQQLAEKEKEYQDLKEIDEATKESLYASREYIDEMKSKMWALENQLQIQRNELIEEIKAETRVIYFDGHEEREAFLEILDNIKDEGKISDKDHKIAVLEKALELAKKEHWKLENEFWGDIPILDYLKSEAEKEVSDGRENINKI